MIDKNKLLEEVATMFNDNGIKTITMDNIAMDLKISKRTLYEIFKDKDDLVAQVILQNLDKTKLKNQEIIYNSENVIQAIFSIAENEIHEKSTRKSNPKMMEDLKKYHSSIYSDIYQNITEEIYNTILKLIERGKVEGLFKKEIDTEIIIYTIKKIVAAYEKDPNFIFSKSPRMLHSTLVIPYLIGISTPQGQELIEISIKKLVKLQKIHE